MKILKVDLSQRPPKKQEPKKMKIYFVLSSLFVSLKILSLTTEGRNAIFFFSANLKGQCHEKSVQTETVGV